MCHPAAADAAGPRRFYLSRPQIHLRLQPEGKLAVIQRGQDVTLFRQALLRLFHLRRVEELDLVFPLRRAVKAAEKARR